MRVRVDGGKNVDLCVGNAHTFDTVELGTGLYLVNGKASPAGLGPQRFSRSMQAPYLHFKQRSYA